MVYHKNKIPVPESSVKTYVAESSTSKTLSSSELGTWSTSVGSSDFFKLLHEKKTGSKDLSAPSLTFL